MNHSDALALLTRETQRARWALAIERALRVSAPLLAAILAWAIVALLGLHMALPYLVESIAALAAWAGFIVLARRTLAAFEMPSLSEARARLARDSKLSTSAFETLGDKPTRYDPIAAALWKREQARALKRMRGVAAHAPRLRLAGLDRFHLRFILPALALGAAMLAGAEAPERLTRAFLPDPAPFFGDAEMQIEAWASPAAYTGAGVVALSDRIGQRVATPPGIEATVRLTGPTGAPLLVFQGGGERLTQRFHRAADGAWEARLQLPAPGKLSIVRFRERAHWRLNSAPDHRPLVAFTAPISNLPNAQISFAWRARDDYGVARMVLRVRPLHPPEHLEYAAALDTPLDLEAGAGAQLEGEALVDISAHPYAGMEVEARLVAIDAIGQEGVSLPQRLTLPSHVFLNPIAKAALEIRRALMAERRPYAPEHAQRRRLISEGDIVIGSSRIELRDPARRPPLERAPTGVQYSARLLDSLTMNPEDGYFRDLAVFLGLRMARSQLDVARDIDDTATAADLLWRTALRAEYGGAGDARRALEAAQAALDEALRSNAPPERIRDLMAALERATDAYLESLVQEAVRRGQTDSVEDTEEQAQISGQDIQQMMRQIEHLSQEGRQAEAAALLQQLGDILENLNIQLGQGGGGEDQSGSGDESAQQRMQDALDALSQTMGEQRALGDETERERAREQQQQQQQGGSSGGAQQGGAGGDDLAQRQTQIRENLGQAQAESRSAGAAPSQNLDAAGQAMREAEGALRRGDMGAARNAQDQALESLRLGAGEMAAQMQGEGGEPGSGAREGGRDPLGRVSGGSGSGDGDTHVPTEMDPAQSRAVFDEIRRRAGDPDRPQAERDYLRRLLERFDNP